MESARIVAQAALQEANNNESDTPASGSHTLSTGANLTLEKGRNIAPSLYQDEDARSEWRDCSKASSVASLTDSIFSLMSGSSMLSTIAGSVGAGERFVALLLGDSVIKPLCTEALDSSTPERFERYFRRMLKEFAMELRKEAENH